MKRYWEQVEIGDMLKPLTKAPISRLQIAQFAAATNEFSPLNLDDEFAKSAGFGGAYAPGLMSLGFVEEALRAFATNIRILSLRGTFQRLIWPGDSLLAKGLLLRRYKKNDEHRIEFSLWCENQNSEVVMKGSSVCILFKNIEHEDNAKLPMPPISATTRDALTKKCAHLVNGSGYQAVEKTSGYKELV
jgi:acyl dehydratase